MWGVVVEFFAIPSVVCVCTGYEICGGPQGEDESGDAPCSECESAPLDELAEIIGA